MADSVDPDQFSFLELIWVYTVWKAGHIRFQQDKG